LYFPHNGNKNSCIGWTTRNFPVKWRQNCLEALTMREALFTRYRENNQSPPGRGSLCQNRWRLIREFILFRESIDRIAPLLHVLDTYLKLIRGSEIHDFNSLDRRSSKRNVKRGKSIMSHEGAKGKKKTTRERWKERSITRNYLRVWWITICIRQREFTISRLQWDIRRGKHSAGDKAKWYCNRKQMLHRVRVPSNISWENGCRTSG